ncbi:hypothetical protein ACH4UM_38710 [Streptomyces sp. NPDC020801]|uniref:hypothetical protein n=1 Tax=Streptomyces sp. NPDC020801 TaxID=3365093 RepID=UPI003799D22D
MGFDELELDVPQVLRMPSLDELPHGSKRNFVGELHTYFRAAGRPSPASIAAAVAQLRGSAPVTVSRETVRRLLKGETTSTWPKVKAVHEVLCRMADQDPTWRRFSDSNDYDEEDDTRTLREYLRDLWNDAVEGVEPDDEAGHPQLAPVPQASPPSAPAGGWGPAPQLSPPPATTGGWGSGGANGGYSDEPPF